LVISPNIPKVEKDLKTSNLLFLKVYQATQFSGTYIDIRLNGLVR